VTPGFDRDGTRADEDYDAYLDALSEKTGLSRDALRRRLRDAASRQLARDRAALPPDEARPADL